MLCASVFFVFGCNTKPEPTPEPTPDPVLSVSPESLAFTAEGGTQNVQVKANNPWTASASGSGISVNPSSGDGNATVTITAAATSSTDPVTGSVSFRSGSLSASVSITQEERKVIQVGDVMTIPAEGGSFAVDVQYNTDVVVEVESAAQSWITFVAVRALTSGKLEFQIAENPDPDVRTGKVTVKDKNGKVSPITLTFAQEEKKVIQVGDVMTIPAEGGTFSVDVQYNTDVVVEVESAAQSWITFVAVRALQSGKLEFQFTENSSTDPRQGTVTVKDKNGKVSPITLTFAQEEKKVIAVGDVMEIPAEGGTFEVDVQYNTDVVVEVESAAQSWITFVAVRALQSGKLEFRFAENNSTDPRQGKVTVKDKNGKVSPITLTFKQAEKTVINVGDVMEIPAEGGTFVVPVQSNTNFFVEIEPDAKSWITHIDTRALTDREIVFEFKFNHLQKERTGLVSLRGENDIATPVTLTFKQGTDESYALERAALEAFYRANNGDNWRDNTNWCSDKPFGEWRDVSTTNSGHVDAIWLDNQGDVYGYIPKEIGNLSELKILRINGGDMSAAYAFSGYRPLPEEIGQLRKLKHLELSWYPFSGTIPESIFNLTSLEYLYINYPLRVEAQPIPRAIGNLKKLRTLGLNYCVTGSLIPEIGELRDLKTLRLDGNELTGSIPETYGYLSNLNYIHLDGNQLSGTIPSSLQRIDLYWKIWPGMIIGNSFSLEDLQAAKIPAPKSPIIKTLSGKQLDLEQEFKKNDYTVLYKAHPDDNPADFFKRLNALKKSNSKLGIITYFENNGDGFIRAQNDASFKRSLAEGGGDWESFIYYLMDDYSTLGGAPFYTGYWDSVFPMGNPSEAVVIGPDKTVVFSTLLGTLSNNKIDDMISFLEQELGSPIQHYESSDFSADGKTKTLQKASTGAGIDIVITGDAFSDRLIADGTFERLARNATDNFFSYEPLKSMRNRFNVYLVNAVSKNEEYYNGCSTALSGAFGYGSAVGGDNEKVLEYVRKAIPDARMDNVLTLVLMNSSKSGGTCYMLQPQDASVYAGGASIAWFPYNDSGLASSESRMAATLVHEAGGHGLGKLGDEYYYVSVGPIPEEAITSHREKQKHNWYLNVDFTGVPSEVRWSRYINDSRYAGEKIGVYIGALGYPSGVWRPTDNSIMFMSSSPDVGFNAPSRAQIYTRIMKLSEGQSWEFDYETFVNWDLAHPTASSSATRANHVEVNEEEHNHVPPVILNKTWRQIIRR